MKLRIYHDDDGVVEWRNRLFLILESHNVTHGKVWEFKSQCWLRIM